jgi:hypothetical protein
VGEGLLVVVMLLGWAAGLDDVEREAALQLHAGSSEDCTQGPGGTTLFTDDFTDIAGGYVKAEDSGVLVGDHFDVDGRSIIHEGAGDFGHQGLHLGYGDLAIRSHRGISHSHTSRSSERPPQW